jgi:hypothetical protein
MATRRAARSGWEVSPAEPRRRRRRDSAAREDATSPPVLSLSHFCRAPFVCFGDVCLGASRTLPLLLHNPSEEVAEVQVPRVRAAQLGFSVAPRRVLLQVGRGRARPRRAPKGEGAPENEVTLQPVTVGVALTQLVFSRAHVCAAYTNCAYALCMLWARP